MPLQLIVISLVICFCGVAGQTCPAAPFIGFDGNSSHLQLCPRENFGVKFVGDVHTKGVTTDDVFFTLSGQSLQGRLAAIAFRQAAIARGILQLNSTRVISTEKVLDEASSASCIFLTEQGRMVFGRHIEDRVHLTLCQDSVCTKQTDIVFFGDNFNSTGDGCSIGSAGGKIRFAYGNGGMLSVITCEDEECSDRTVVQRTGGGFPRMVTTQGLTYVLHFLQDDDSTVLLTSCKTTLNCSLLRSMVVRTKVPLGAADIVVTSNPVIVLFADPDFTLLQCPNFACTLELRLIVPLQHSAGALLRVGLGNGIRVAHGISVAQCPNGCPGTKADFSNTLPTALELFPDGKSFMALIGGAIEFIECNSRTCNSFIVVATGVTRLAVAFDEDGATRLLYTKDGTDVLRFCFDGRCR